jgi:hypothetical protein
MVTTPAQIRGLQHNLQARAERALAAGLNLRKRTAEHLRRLSEGREYLASRYGAELAATLSQTNRLLATLEEVATKVAKAATIPSKKSTAPESRSLGR